MSPPFTSLGVGSKEQPSCVHALRRARRTADARRSDGATFEVRRPGDNELVGTAASATIDDVNRICAAAAAAQPAWEATAPHLRAEVFFKAAELLATERWRKEVVDTLQAETACHAGWAGVALTIAATTLRHAAAICLNIRGETFQSQAPGGQVVLERRAAGVVFSIAPWNAPFNLTARGCCIPLACGNSVVLKSSEYSPRSQHLWWQLMVEAGVPDGVVSIFRASQLADHR